MHDTSARAVPAVDPAAPGDDELARRYAWPDPGPDRWSMRAIMIASLDGGATRSGRSGPLGNEVDRRLFAVLRDLSDVILVGAGTVRAEGYRGIAADPRRADLRVRWGLTAAPPPIAVVTARGLDPASPLFAPSPTAPIIVTTHAAAAAVPGGVEVIRAGERKIDPAAALAGLADRGLRRVDCEGGPALLRSLLDAGLVDELCLTLAPVLLGSATTRLVPGPLDPPAEWALADSWSGGDHLFTRYTRRSES